MQSTARLITLGVLAIACSAQVSCTQSTAEEPFAGIVPTSAAAPPAMKTAAGEAPKKVTDVTSAVRQAVNWHPKIAEAAARAGQQREAINEAKSGYLPSVGGGIGFGAETGDNRSWSPKFNLSASQMVYDFGKVSNRIDAQSAVYDARQAELLTTVDEIIRDVVISAVEILRNGELAQVAEDQINDVQAIERLVEARTDRGASTRSDKLQAEARVQAAQSTALELSAQKQRWQSMLATVTGSTVPPQIGRSLPKPVSRACGSAAPIWDNVPAVIAARSRMTEAEARLRLARSEVLPTVALEASSQFDILDGNSDPDYLVGLRLRGDLYNGGAFKAQQNAARLGAQAAASATAAATYDVQRIWLQSSTQVRSLEALQKSLSSREVMMRETRDLYQKQFLDLGTRTLLDVLNADQELHVARFDEINTRYDLYKLNVECAYAAGRLRELFGLTSASQQVVASDRASISTASRVAATRD
ncbi:TolC family protein [Rhizobium sp. SAFR-030]|uniref:TolC family protein n=1 Tax=Rhizobium sp. SAFR-030 TaxID=3387277 RepID=UPI003F811BCD